MIITNYIKMTTQMSNPDVPLVWVTSSVLTGNHTLGYGLFDLLTER